MKKTLLFSAFFAVFSSFVFAQAPNISYSAAPVFTAGVAITSLQPSNTGGIVPANNYGEVSGVADSTGVYSSTGVRNPPAGLRYIRGLTMDSQGNVYVAMAVSNLIKKITPQGTVSTFAGTGGSNGKFYFPGSMCIDKAGNIFLTDSLYRQVKKITPAGVVSKWGAASDYLGGIAVDKAGNVYVSEGITNRIRKIDLSGQSSTFVSGMAPSAMTIDKNGNFFVGIARQVKKITPDGVVTTIAGKAEGGIVDGADTSARFWGPSSLTTDNLGNIYAADYYTIRKITPAGVVSTIAGAPFKYGYENGIGPSARFYGVGHITFDGTGSLYVAEDIDVRKIVLTGYRIDKPLPPGLIFDGKTGIISGKPTGTFPATVFKITAHNLIGESTASVTLRSVSSNAGLTSLYMSNGVLNPLFSSNTLKYSATFASTILSTLITPTLIDSTASIKINGVTVSNGSHRLVQLVTGTNTVNIAVTASDGVTKKSYTLTLFRQPSADVSTTALQISPGILKPTAKTDSLMATVAGSISSISVLATATNAGATVKVNGVVTAQNTYSAPVELHLGVNVIPVVITAQDGFTQRKLTITIIRGSASTAVTLIKISPGKLLRIGTLDSWTAAVGATTTSVRVIAAASNAGATFKVNGVVTAQNTYSAALPLSIGVNTILVELTAEDCVTKRTLTLTVVRGSANTGVSALKITPGTLKRDSASNYWNAALSASVTSLRVLAATSDANAKIKINGVAVASNTYSEPVPVHTGVNYIPVEITAQDGVTVRYLWLAIAVGSSSTNIAELQAYTRVGTLTLKHVATDNWIATVDNIADGVLLHIIPSNQHTVIMWNFIWLYASNYYPVTIPLNVGINYIPVQIYAQDGVTIRNIVLTITRLPVGTVNRQALAVIQKAGLLPEALPQEINVKQAVSPNGDGINDNFAIEGINAFPENTVKVMNRNGDVIYEAKGYDNGSKAFDGHSNSGTLQQAGTYFYSIEYKAGDVKKHKTGYLVLKY